MTRISLFTRPECHLCEEAAGLLRKVAPRESFELVDIESDLALITRYGTRVPVLLRKDTGAELDWPFDALDLARFLTP